MTEKTGRWNARYHWGRGGRVRRQPSVQHPNDAPTIDFDLTHAMPLTSGDYQQMPAPHLDEIDDDRMDANVRNSARTEREELDALFDDARAEWEEKE